jgi:hypothetical protein
MKKKVCYAIGAAGLLPITAALFMPAAGAATGNPVPSAPVKTAKAVSARFHRLAPQSMAATPDSPASDCTGYSWIRSPKTGPTYVGFWYSRVGDTTCVGTIKAGISSHVWGDGWSGWRIRLWNGKTLEDTWYGTTDNVTTVTEGVHHYYNGSGNNPYVCLALKWARTQEYTRTYCAHTPA